MEKSFLQKISFLSFLLLSTVSANNSGGLGGVVNRMPLSAVAIGRGGAATADPELGAAFWNPVMAGQGKLGRTRLALSGLFYYRGINDLGEQFFDDGSSVSGESFTNLAAKLGMGAQLSKKFSLGISMGWYYGSMPVDYREGVVVRSKSSSIGGVTLLGSWNLPRGLVVAAGVKELLLTDVWNEENSSGYAVTLADTSLSPVVGAVSYEKELFGQKLRVDSDFNLWLFNSYFNSIEHPYATWNNGLTWTLNDLVLFRMGVRDFLINSTMFDDGESYKLESSPRLSGGLGLNFENRIKVADLRINYAISASGASAGVDHYFDFLFDF